MKPTGDIELSHTWGRFAVFVVGGSSTALAERIRGRFWLLFQKKIDKRGRKLVDYDSQRHQLEGLQRSARRDEYKIARVKDQLEQAKSTYESLNKVGLWVQKNNNNI